MSERKKYRAHREHEKNHGQITRPAVCIRWSRNCTMLLSFPFNLCCPCSTTFYPFFVCCFVSTTIFFVNHCTNWANWANDNKENLTIIITWSIFVSFYLSLWPLMKCNVCLPDCLFSPYAKWIGIFTAVLFCIECTECVYDACEMSLFMSERLHHGFKRFSENCRLKCMYVREFVYGIVWQSKFTLSKCSTSDRNGDGW